ncbi:tetratricopeptide repeat protein [Spirosoma flavum]|uniref:Tetratricopeptide repeat protein n=1 Tax=Spirosoma flavum TaxID=2048557 RepID=A0ABW6AB11_9BACT
MKRLFFLSLLLPIAVQAQDGERILKACASMLANNRAPQPMPFFGIRRENIRLDTMSASAQSYRHRAFTYLWQGNYEEAALWLEKTGDNYPREHGIIGEIYLSKLQDYPRALRHLDTYDALTPNFDDMISNNPISYLRGLTYRSIGNHTKAIEQFSIAIDSLSRKHGPEWVNYKHFVSRAVSYIATQQSEKAVDDLNKAAKNFTRSALIAYHRGRALLQLNRTTEARTAFEDASFFFKSLRAERTADYQEDEFNPVYEEEIDEALTHLKNQTR